MRKEGEPQRTNKYRKEISFDKRHTFAQPHRLYIKQTANKMTPKNCPQEGWGCLCAVLTNMPQAHGYRELRPVVEQSAAEMPAEHLLISAT